MEYGTRGIHGQQATWRRAILLPPAACNYCDATVIPIAPTLRRPAVAKARIENREPAPGLILIHECVRSEMAEVLNTTALRSKLRGIEPRSKREIVEKALELVQERWSPAGFVDARFVLDPVPKNADHKARTPSKPSESQMLKPLPRSATAHHRRQR